jgi:alkylhydroperoxidase family enzyme
LLRFVGKVTKNLPAITFDDTAALQAAGWDDEAIYYAITTCALFNFYNRWITATGVPEMSEEAHRQQGKMLASRGYGRD